MYSYILSLKRYWNVYPSLGFPLTVCVVKTRQLKHNCCVAKAVFIVAQWRLPLKMFSQTLAVVHFDFIMRFEMSGFVI